MYVVNGSDGRCLVAVRLIVRRCPLFRASVKGGSTVVMYSNNNNSNSDGD